MPELPPLDELEDIENMPTAQLLALVAEGTPAGASTEAAASDEPR
jgi:hypothetical protein